MNDYNSLQFYLSKANLDLQYVADSSLVLANYVTAYVTKAEKSHIQEILVSRNCCTRSYEALE